MEQMNENNDILSPGENCGAETGYTDELRRFLSSAYGLRVKNILPEKRGFFGETWHVQAENGEYFLKIDYWKHHRESYRRSLSVVKRITGSGISFVPKVIETKDGGLYENFRNGTAALFEYVEGELLDDCPPEMLYNRLAKVYALTIGGAESDTNTEIETESFGVERIDTFRELKKRKELPDEVKKAISERENDICRYADRLKQFSDISSVNFYLTHGDAGGNCILSGDEIFIVDWDSVMLAPIERDAWIYICREDDIEKINSILAKNGINYSLNPNRLSYYSYDLFFYYLNEYLISLLEADSAEKKAQIFSGLVSYLSDCWIYERLDAADAVQLSDKR